MRWLIYLACATFLALTLALPVAASLWQGFDVAWLGEALRHPVHRQGLFNALLIAATTTVLATALALPLAWLTTRYEFWGKPLAEGLLLMPLLLPPFVAAIGVQAVLGRHGALNAALASLGVVDLADPPDWLGGHRFAAVCVLEALGLYPLLYLALAGAISRLDPSLVEAARTCGAGAWSAWRRVTVPLLAPSLLAGASVVFVWSFTELGTPLMLGYDRHIAVQIFNGLADIKSNPMPFTLAVIMLAVAIIVYLGAQALFAQRAAALLGKGGSIASPVPLDARQTVAAWAVILAAVALASFPHLAIVLVAFSGDWYDTILPTSLGLTHLNEALANPLVGSGIWISLKASLLATVLAVIVGVAVAWICVRWRPPGWRVLDAAAMAPLAIPGIVLALGFLAIGSQASLAFPLLAPWLNPLVNPIPLLVVAYAVRRLPHVVRGTHSALQQIPPALEEAAAVHGAGPLTRLARITVPLVIGGILAGAILAFSFSMLEVADSLMLTQKRDHWPLTKVMWGLTDILGSGPAIACAVGAWTMAVIAAAVAAAAALSGRGLGGLFRER